MLALADMGGSGRLLLAVIVVLVLIFAAIVVWLLEPLWRRVPWLRGWVYHWTDRGERGASGAGVGLDVLPWQPNPLESMQWDEDREAWEAHRWEQQFRANHDGATVAAAFDQQGGWVSGFCDAPPPYPGGGHVSFAQTTIPPLEAGPRVPREGGPAVTGPEGTPWPGHPDPGLGAGLLSAGYNSHLLPLELELPPQAKVDSPAQLELAHEEYRDAGPVPGVLPPAPAEWAGPVPPTADGLALAAWVRAELSRQDADRLNYLHDLAERWAA